MIIRRDIHRKGASRRYHPAFLGARDRRRNVLREDRRPPISCVLCRRSLCFGTRARISPGICVSHMLTVRKRQSCSIAANGVCYVYVVRVRGSFQRNAYVYAGALGERPGPV